MISIDASDCLRNLKSIERRILDVPRMHLPTVVRVALRSIQDSTLFRDRTGELRGTLTIIDTGAFSKRLVAPANHAKWVNDGTQPHVILPVNGQFLRFVVNGRVIYAKKVNHPGTTKRQFMEHAGEAGGQAMKILFEEGAERAVDYTAGTPE